MFRKLFALLAAMALLFTSFAAAESTFEVSYTVTFQQTDARSMIDMINDFRTGSEAWYWNSDDTEKVYVTGLEELVLDADLERIAMQRAAECAIYYSHTRPSDTSWSTAYNDFAITDTTARGENIAAGYGSFKEAESVFIAWREDDMSYAGQGHRRNMLSTYFNAIGIGHVVYQGMHFWAQALACRSTPQTTLPQANDGEAVVYVMVSDALVTSATLALTDQSEIQVGYGETAALPSATVALKLEEQWPSFRDADVLAVTPVWSSAAEVCASVEGDRVLGKAVGRTTLQATVAGASAQAPVRVTYDGGLTPDFVLPSGLQSLGADAFRATDVTAIVIPDGVTAIDSGTFAGCTALKQITIPASVQKIAEDAFQGCAADLTILCTVGSAAADFAQTMGYPVILYMAE